MSRASPPKLEYARDGSRLLRRWGIRLFMLAWAGLTLFLAYDKWGGWIKLQADVLTTPSACLQFTEPADRVVFDTDRSRVAAMAGRPGYRGANRANLFGSGSTPPFDAIVSTPAETNWDRLMGAARRMENWQELRNPSTATASSGGGLFASQWPDAKVFVFLHSRRAANGPARLVRAWAEWYSGQKAVILQAATTAPAGWLGNVDFTPTTVPPPPGVSTSVSFALAPVPNDIAGVSTGQVDPIRLFAGQADPADAARFTIDYETPLGRGTIEARLRPDDNVEMRILSGPSLNPPAMQGASPETPKSE